MSLLQQSQPQPQPKPRIITSYYQTDSNSIFQCLRLNSTTRIAELIVPYRKRILKHKNKMIESRVYQVLKCRYTKNENRFCPMQYTKIICHACCNEIKLHDLYLSKNGEHGRSKFYHISCAVTKNVI